MSWRTSHADTWRDKYSCPHHLPATPFGVYNSLEFSNGGSTKPSLLPKTDWRWPTTSRNASHFKQSLYLNKEGLGEVPDMSSVPPKATASLWRPDLQKIPQQSHNRHQPPHFYQGLECCRCCSCTDGHQTFSLSPSSWKNIRNHPKNY